MAKTNLKVPPHDLEIEVSTLGALMIDNDAIIKVADILVSKDFYRPQHQDIYKVMMELFDKHEPIDILSVTAKLKKKKLLKKIGGAGYLTDLINSVPTAAHIEHYAKIVKENSIRRSLLNASAEINEKVFDNKEDFETLLDQVEQKIFSISQVSRPQKFTHIKDDLPAAYERLEKLHRGEGALRGLATGFKQLDDTLSGLQRSEMIIIGARPSFGKTAFALDIARQVANDKKSVGIFSLEMSSDQVIDRMISAQANIPLWRLRTGRLSGEAEFNLIQEAFDHLSKRHIFIDDTPSPNVMQLRSMARRLQIEHGLDLLIIDYLQLIEPRSGFQSMVQQVTEISRAIKSLARELNIPVIAISQLSRAVDQREAKIPRLSDLRESGSLEQDADVVLLIYRKDRGNIVNNENEEGLVEMIIAKNRNGPLGSVKLKFNSEIVSFRSLDTKHVLDE